MKKELKGNVMIYYVDKLISDDKMIKYQNKIINPSMIAHIIDHDADVYTTDGKLLLKFRKHKLPIKNVNLFYDNVSTFALTHPSRNRGNATGSKKKNVKDNPNVMSSILGYFDRWSPKQKYIFKRLNMKTPLEVRESLFNVDYPEKFAKVVPLIQDIDKLYKKYTPIYYNKQRIKANQTYFRIPNTSFTTITTNINFQTTMHKDLGDDVEGFGNLAVIEHGKYKGGETCFPQYGIGVDVRTTDILFMDVHEWHANLPIKLESPDAIRLSIVCYLRYNVWNRTKHKPKTFMIRHNKTIKNIRGKVH